MEYKNLRLEKDSNIALITLNRPEVRNALNPPMWEEIHYAIRDCDLDKDVRVVIITGAGGIAFASGADIRILKDFDTREVIEFEVLIQGSLNEVENLDKPVIAAIDGFALGGGCELALACDVRIATSRSKLGFPEVNLGLIPGAGGTQRLQRLVGIGKAKELIFTSDIISAQEAKELGMLNKVVEKTEDLLPAAKAMAEKIMVKGPMAVSLAKAAINMGANTDLNSGLLIEKFASTIAFSTEDRYEGTTAFIEKRKPNFKGK